jgi:uncharacterized damage-inducible protein DinB
MNPEQLDHAGAVQAKRGPDTPDAVGPVREVLGQLRGVVGLLKADDYTRQPVTTFGGSIGGHVRHCLDHIDAVVLGADGGVIDYDHRERGTEVESDPLAALAEIDRIDSSLSVLADGVPGRAVAVKVMLSDDGSVTELGSTVGRELAFVFSHTIHHGAMIGGMVRALGGTVPEGFGLAPSTIAYRKR